jgi:exodeoxyribonuclease III
MRIITLNVNGVRAAARKGLFDWLPRQNADLICLQEIKVQAAQVQEALFHPEGYYCHYVHAIKKGYSGVGLYARREPHAIIEGFNSEEFDPEGRYLEMRFGKLSVASLYMPSGSSSEERQQAKFRFMDEFMPYLTSLRRKRRDYIICGDWNIAHKQIDLKNWRGNQKNSGFLPEERAWLDELFENVKFVDAFRVVNQQPDQYTWWSNRGQAWDKNVGWRIDYQVISPALRMKVSQASIYKDERFSDHAPLIIDYDYDF